MSPTHNIGARVLEPTKEEPRLRRLTWVMHDGKSATAVCGYDRDDVDDLLAELRGALARCAEMAEAGASLHDIHEVAARAATDSITPKKRET